MNCESEEPIVVLLSDVTRLFWRRLELALRAEELDLTVAEARTLVAITKAQGERQAVLAERMRIEPMTLVGFLDRLEARGLVVRTTDPADRRAKLVRIAPAADATVTRLLDVAGRVKAEVVVGLDVAEVDALRHILQRIRGTLDRLEGGLGARAA